MYLTQQIIDKKYFLCYTIIYINVLHKEAILSLLTSVSVKEEYRSDYNTLRQYLKLNDISMGDFIIESWKLKVNNNIFDTCFAGEEG